MLHVNLGREEGAGDGGRKLMGARREPGTTAENRPDKDARRARLREICGGLPEAESESDQHITFRVRNKTFAYYLDDHHGDGRVAVVCKTQLGENTELVSRDPVRYFVPPYVGPKGWVGLRIDLPDVDWEEVAALIRDSYRLVAPKRLARLLDRPSVPNKEIPDV